MSCHLVNVTLVIPQYGTLENLVGQLQPYCDSYLAVINGTIRVYQTLDDVPISNRKVDHYGQSNECYIRDIDRNEMICCFDQRLINNMLHISAKKSSRPTSLSDLRNPLYDSRSPSDDRIQKNLKKTDPSVLHLNLDVVSAEIITQTLSLQ